MSPSLQTMGFFMSDINFCNTKEQLNHLGEVVTGKVDGSPTGADIDTSTLPYTGQVRKTLPALEGEYEQSITDKEAEADAAIDSYRLLNKGPYAAGILLEDKFQYITYNGESYFAVNPPYTTTATTPEADVNLFVGGYVNVSQAESISENTVKNIGILKYDSVSDMVSGSPTSANVGGLCASGGTLWRRTLISVPDAIEDFKPIGFTSCLDAKQDQAGIQDYVKVVTSRNDIPKTVTSERVIVYGTLDGEDLLRLSLEGVDDVTLGTDPNDISVKKNIRVRNTRLSGPTSQPSNDNAVLTVARVDGALITGNEIEQAYNSFSLEYGNLPPPNEERRSVKSVVAHNVFRGHYMGYEMFSCAFSALVGNVAASDHPTIGIQHGLRITGYGKDHLGQGHDLRNRGNAYVGNAYNKFANGISQQTGSYGNITVSAITDATNGIQFTENTTVADAISESNIHIFAIDGVQRGSFIPDPKGSMFIGTVRDFSEIGWKTLRGARDATSNSYDLNITEGKSGAVFEDNNSYIKVVASDLQEGGVEIKGDHNIVDVVIDDINISGSNSSALNISGNGNIIRFNGYAIRQPFSEVIITGSQNQLEFNGNVTLPQGQVAVNGPKNIIRGHCIITAASNPDNDYRGVYGWSKSGTVTVTTSASGVASLGVSSDLPVNISGYELTASSIEFTNPHLVVRKGSGDQVLVLNAQTSAIIASQSVTLRYSYVCYK